MSGRDLGRGPRETWFGEDFYGLDRAETRGIEVSGFRDPGSRDPRIRYPGSGIPGSLSGSKMALLEGRHPKSRVLQTIEVSEHRSLMYAQRLTRHRPSRTGVIRPLSRPNALRSPIGSPRRVHLPKGPLVLERQGAKVRRRAASSKAQGQQLIKAMRCAAVRG